MDFVRFLDISGYRYIMRILYPKFSMEPKAYGEYLYTKRRGSKKKRKR